MKKSNILPSIVLGSICLVVAVLLSVLNIFTAPIIAERQAAAADAALLEVLPGGKNFEELTLDASYPAVVKKGWKADGGFVFQMEVTGYKSGLVIMCGVDADGKIAGVKHISSAETNGVEGDLNGKYNNMTIDSFETQLIAGSTLTSKAYAEAVKAALQSAVLAGGGDVDTRTPEQILQDNCNAALGTTGLAYEKWFATEVLVGVDAVYYTETNSGLVVVIGESFIGVNETGVLTEGVSQENADKALAAYTTMYASAITKLSPEQIAELTNGQSLDKSVTDVFKTDSGNFVFLLSAEGYSSLFEYSVEKVPIIIMLSISADGKIIDVRTASHSESIGYGDGCATEEYYEQFKGKENGDITVSVTKPDYMKDQIPADTTDVGAIASATYTTYGYQKAVKAAFAAFELLTNQEGGND